MEISVTSNIITVTGNIKTLSDYQMIKDRVDSVVQNNGSVEIKIVDSISITSSVIGYFNKLVLKDKIDLSIVVGNAQLKELFDELDLTRLFKVRKG